VILNTRGSSLSPPAPALPPVQAEPPPPMPEVPPPMEKPKQASAPGSAPEKKVYATGIPGRIEKWQNDVPFEGDPLLRYLAWLPEKQSEPLQLWAPDGSEQPAHGAIPDSLWDWWRKGMLNPDYVRAHDREAKTAGTRKLVLVFSHPAIDESSQPRAHFYSAPGKEVTVSSWSHLSSEPKPPGKDGWLLLVCPLPSPAEAPAYDIQLELTAGTWSIPECFPVDYRGGHGFGNIVIGGTGEDVGHHAFITVIADESRLPVPQWNMLAHRTDGIVVGNMSANGFFLDNRTTNTVRFAQSLSELSDFFLRYRDARKIDFKNIRLPPLPSPAN